jgi:D-alanyl-D-alanine carboxypeptidase (penicillin-binding protein 5/6)
MAKMMTSLIAMEEIQAGKLSLDDSVTVSARAAGMGGSQIFAAEGQVFSVRTLLAATMVQSANDAATALAEKIAGSNEAFARLMNGRAQELGLEGSTFYDPHGLPNPEGENVMTARDLALVGTELMRYPLMREYAAAPTLPFENATFTAGMTNPNFLLRDYAGAYGIKTGYTVSAGFSITAAARRGDMDVIAVLTGARASRGPQSSFDLAGRLMDEVFLSWSTVVPVREGSVAGDVPVQGGTAPAVPAVAAQDVRALVPRGDEANVRWTLQPQRIEAPVAPGDTVGTIIVQHGDLEVARVPALAADAVERRPWWRFWAGGPGAAGQPWPPHQRTAATSGHSAAAPDDGMADASSPASRKRFSKGRHKDRLPGPLSIIR